jgi:aldehyde:ferredoxin oxidoreductase
MNGYQGKILHLDLTKRSSSVIDTEKYTQWGGGHGIGSAVYWDLVKDRSLADGLDPRNVVTIMTSPLSGTMVPSASGRVEVQGVGIQQYPVNWYTRSNFGGRFGGQLKYAGWDGIAIEGKADTPVWIEIDDDKVVFRDAKGLWGKDTQDTQKAIWAMQAKGNPDNHGWTEMSTRRDGGRTTQRSAIITIGPAGENLSAFGCLIHDAGNGAGQGGFGAVFGGKNLKAISVLGSGSVDVADPAILFDARLKDKNEYAYNPGEDRPPYAFGGHGISPQAALWWNKSPEGGSGPQSCQGCINGCRARWEAGLANEASCQETACYAGFDVKKHGQGTEATHIAVDLMNRLGINSFEVWGCLAYFEALNEKGVIGSGKQVNTALKMEDLGETSFIKDFLSMVAYRKDIGEDLAKGTVRAAVKWGRYNEDIGDGSLPFPYWGMPEHAYDPRLEIEWGYGSILGSRDINEHCFNWLMWDALIAMGGGKEPAASAEEWARIVTDKMEPYAGDMQMMNYGTDNMYSDSWAKTVAWHRHYGQFWKESALFCDWRYPDFINYHRPDKVGESGKAEPVYWKAVTGQELSFADGVELGRKIWNLDNAIWTLQGRHRDDVKLARYIYEHDAKGWELGTFFPLPVEQDGKWEYSNVCGRRIDEVKWEEWKTRFYDLEGWDAKTGWPTRETLSKLGLDAVAEELERAGKLGGVA